MKFIVIKLCFLILIGFYSNSLNSRNFYKNDNIYKNNSLDKRYLDNFYFKKTSNNTSGINLFRIFSKKKHLVYFDSFFFNIKNIFISNFNLLNNQKKIDNFLLTNYLLMNNSNFFFQKSIKLFYFYKIIINFKSYLNLSNDLKINYSFSFIKNIFFNSNIFLDFKYFNKRYVYKFFTYLLNESFDYRNDYVFKCNSIYIKINGPMGEIVFGKFLIKNFCKNFILIKKNKKFIYYNGVGIFSKALNFRIDIYFFIDNNFTIKNKTIKRFFSRKLLNIKNILVNFYRKLVFYKNKYYYKKYFSYGISISYRWVKFYHNNLKFAIGNYGDVYGNIDYLNLFSKSKLNIGSGCFWIKTHWKQISFRNVILFSFGNIEDFTKNKIYDFYNIYLKSDFRYFFFKKIINLGFSFKFVSNFLNKKSAFNNVKFLEKYSNNFFSDTKNYDLYFFFQKIKYNLNIIKIDSYIKLIIFKHVKIFANIYFSFSDKLKENFLNKFHSTYFGIRISMLVANRNSLFLRLNYNYLILLKNILKNNKKKNNNIYKGSVEMGIRY